MHLIATMRPQLTEPCTVGLSFREVLEASAWRVVRNVSKCTWAVLEHEKCHVCEEIWLFQNYRAAWTFLRDRNAAHWHALASQRSQRGQTLP